MHLEMMKPHIPLLAQDHISSGLRVSQLLRSVSLSSFLLFLSGLSQFHHFKAEKGNNCSFSIANYRVFAVKFFY